jgi:2,3-dihydroxybiphenyl 1,2-dioxygenase
MSVGSLGYVALNVTDMSAWLEMVTSVFGMQIVARENSAAIDLRIDDYHHRFTLYPSDEDSIAAIGWEVESLENLNELVIRLTNYGVAVRDSSLEECEERKVRNMVTFVDPTCGMTVELFYSPQSEKYPFCPSKGIDGYKTGNLGLGHVVYFVDDYEKSKQFYTDVMGFDVSDYIVWDDREKDATFFHCNERHHSLAIMPPFGELKGGMMGHIMIEANSLDDVGRAYDLVRDKAIPLMMEFGKHTNDHTQSFYIFTPSGFALEYGYGGRLIDENWKVHNYDSPMLWGHRMPNND